MMNIFSEVVMTPESVDRLASFLFDAKGYHEKTAGQLRRDGLKLSGSTKTQECKFRAAKAHEELAEKCDSLYTLFALLRGSQLTIKVSEAK